MAVDYHLSLTAFYILCYLILTFPFLALSAPIFSHSIYPNFTAIVAQYVDNSGSFMASSNGTFRASLASTPQSMSSGFYFSIIHMASNTIIWTANRGIPLSYSSALLLTVDGLRITTDNGPSKGFVWSTPPLLNSQVAALQLLETGNLILVDAQNVSLWQSFDEPTDTLVIGQRLHVGMLLTGTVANNDLSVGDCRLILTTEDLVLQWKGQTYWKLSMDTNAFKNSNGPVSSMAIHATGLFLFGDNGVEVVFQVSLEPAAFKIAKLGSEGSFSINSFTGNNWVQEFVRPANWCQRPFVCGKLGFCTNETCICPSGFVYSSPQKDQGCVPREDTVSLPSGCNASLNGTEVNSSTVYLNLQYGMDYFANYFSSQVKHGVNLSLCQGLCSRNCSCLGIFHANSSGSCYPLDYDLGSIMSSSDSEEDRLGYIKAFINPSENPTMNKKQSLLGAGFVVIVTLTGFFLLVTVVVLAIIRLRRRRPTGVNLGRWNSSASEELEITTIPGLPVRYNYEELVAATENFKTQVGSGGFGTVYKGTMQDNTVVAVKKITSLGIQGKKEFRTEIAAIGNIHHVNLVKLRGFCIQQRHCFLVFEYMNRGSLEKMLFGKGPVLEWKKRYEIALGMARGLAYLHSGCQHKIIHCDIKPENILLHDDLHVKISDFGLAKLLSHEKSKLLTTMRGTRGYLAPEWLTSYGITDKADVYSYGMVLLELIRGRRNLLVQSSGTENDDSEGNGPSFSSNRSDQRVVYFPPLALEMHKQRRYMELADLRLEGGVSVRSEEVEKLVRVALCCVHVVPALRPSMSNVVAMLEGRFPVGEPRVEALEFLGFYCGKFIEDSRKLTRMGYAEEVDALPASNSK